MILNPLYNQSIKNIFYSLLLFSSDVFSQRVSNEDIYGDTFSGGNNFFGIIIGLLVILFIIKIMASNSGFRNGILLYAGTILSIVFIYKLFGEEVTIIYCLGLVVFLIVLDKKTSLENSKEQKDNGANGKNSQYKNKDVLEKPIKINLRKYPKNNQTSIQCIKCGSLQINDDSTKIVECNLCKHKGHYGKIN